MKMGKGQKTQLGDPEVGEESNFFSDFFPDEESGLVTDEAPIEEKEENEEESTEEKEKATSEEEQEVETEEEDEEQEEEEDEQEEEENEVEEDTDLTKAMSSFVKAGILDVVDEDKEYTPDEEGFQELISDTVQNRLKAEKEKQREEVRELESFLEAYPDATVEDFIQEQEDFDYNSVDEADPENQVHLLQEFYEMQGYDREEIIATIKEHQQTKSLGRHAKKAKFALAKAQEETVQARREAREATQKQREEQIVENRRQFEQKILKTENIGGLKLPIEERQQLANYILEPVDEAGRSKLQVEEDEGEQLLYAYIKMKKLSLDKLAKKAETKAALKFKKSISKHTDRDAKPKKTRQDPNVVAEPDDLSGLDSWSM